MTGHRRGGDDESGIALLIVLLAITLLTIVVVEFTDYAQVETHLALSARNGLEATYLARSGVNIAEAIVSADGHLDPGRDGLQDVWAGPFPPQPIGDGTAVIRIRDEARFLNINEVLAGGTGPTKPIEVFRRLFQRLQIDERILWAIVDWIDADSAPHVDPPGAEQLEYMGLAPPRFVRNKPLVTFRELLLVRGITPTILAKLEPFVTVLPATGSLKVNVNTAPREVLAALSPELSDNPGVVDRLISTRETEAFTDAKGEIRKAVPAFMQALTGPGEDLLATNSAYFRLESVGEVNDVRRGIVEIVKRDGAKVRRFEWTPSTANLALTSQPPSDFLATLPVFGSR